VPWASHIQPSLDVTLKDTLMPADRRSLRRFMRTGVPIVGVAAILAGAFTANEMFTRGALGLVGAVLTLISSFALQDRVFPNERRLVALRAEVDAFVVAVRRTNAAAVATSHGRGEIATFHAACDDLVERARHVGTVVAATHGLPSAEAGV
jgi:hypothetical protein